MNGKSGSSTRQPPLNSCTESDLLLTTSIACGRCGEGLCPGLGCGPWPVGQVTCTPVASGGAGLMSSCSIGLNRVENWTQLKSLVTATSSRPGFR